MKDLIYFKFELREAFEAIEKHGVNVSESTNNSDRSMLLLIHNVEC
jgi:hypothetical protein